MLLDRLAAMPGVSFVRPKGAFYIMVSIPGLGTPMQAAEFLLDAGLAPSCRGMKSTSAYSYADWF